MDRVGIESMRESFIERHGGLKAARRLYRGTGERRRPTEYFVFPDGALLHQHAWATNVEPPADEVERLKLMIEHRTIIWSEAKQSVEDQRNAINAIFNPKFKGTYAGPSSIGTKDEAKEELHKRVKSVWNAKYALEVLEEKLAELVRPPEKTQQEDELERQMHAQDTQFWEEVRNITT